MKFAFKTCRTSSPNIYHQISKIFIFLSKFVAIKWQFMENYYVRHGLFLTLVIMVTIAFIGLIGAFLLACFWAGVLALIFRNTYRRIRIRLRGRSNLAASITLLLIILVVVIPLTLVTLALVDQSTQLYNQLRSQDINFRDLLNFVENQIPAVETFLARFGIEIGQLQERLSNFAVSATQAIGNQALSVTQNTVNFFIQFSLMLYLLFFFLRDGQEIINAVVNVVPLGNITERRILKRFASVTRATMKGTLTIAIIQGSIGGALFGVLGIPAAVLWGVLMTLLSLLPVGGSAIVWVPTAIIMLIQGAYGKAIAIIIVGSLFIGLVDNLLRPILVGRDAKMPDYLVLLTTLGGISWFGLTGFILGPVIAALFLTFWEIAGAKYGGRDT